MLSQFQLVYMSKEKLIVDESVVSFQGRLHFRKYIPGKVHEDSCKVYKICSPDSYNCNLQIYAERSNKESSLSHSKSVVISIITDNNIASNINPNGKTSTHCLEKASDPKSKSRKRCRSCYKIIPQNRGSKEARPDSQLFATHVGIHNFCELIAAN